MDKPVSLIIGLGQTVGDAIAKTFVESGHQVLAVDPRQSLLDEVTKSTGDKATLLHGAVHTRLGLRNALASALESFGHVDNVICVPELPLPDTLTEISLEDFETSLLRSVKGAVQTLRIFSEEMDNERVEPGNTTDRLRQAGSFTFILSLGAKMAQPGWFSESVTQHAILGVVKAAAIELAMVGVRVNAIIALRPRAEGREKWLKDRTPLGRPALAEEIADAALFLSSPQSAIITGEALVLDGGRTTLSGLMVKHED